VAHARSRLNAVAPPPAEALLAALSVAVVTLDAEGCIAGVNAAAEVLLNGSAAWLRHQPLGMVLRLPRECLDGLLRDAAFVAYACEAETRGGQRLRDGT